MSNTGDDRQAAEEIARDFIDALSSGDTERILGCYTDDATVWTAGSLPISGLHDLDEIRALCDGLLGAFPEGLKFTITAMTIGDDRVAIEAEGHGVHASGRSYDQNYHFLLELCDGKVAQMKEYFDTELAREVLLG